jgi:acylphosphatase
MKSMKLKIKITGPKVHDVGYRPCLTELAMRLALRGFEVYNDDEDEQQMVVVLVEGDEQRITKFYNSAMKERPQLARVDDVRSEDYPGDVMPMWQFASINTASQMNKAIPLLMAVKANTDAIPQIKANTDAIPQIKANTDAIPQIKANTDAIPQIKANTDAIPLMKANTDAIPLVLEEIKGLREDIQPGYNRQVQKDIRAIKERLGMS